MLPVNTKGPGSWPTPRLLLLAGLLALSGCAGMSREECASTDWRLMGYEDGARGMASHRIGRYRESCAEHGISPDLDVYLAGRKEGLKAHCTPQNGYALGARGKGLAAVCPAELDAAFRSAHARGLDLHRARSDMRKLEHRIRDTETAIDKKQNAVKKLEAELVADGTPMKRRVVALVEIRDLEQEVEALENRLADLGHEQAHARERLQDLQASAH